MCWWWWVDPNATAWSYQWPKNQLVGRGFVFVVGGVLMCVCSTKAGVDGQPSLVLHSSLSSIHGHACPRTMGLKKFF